MLEITCELGSAPFFSGTIAKVVLEDTTSNNVNPIHWTLLLDVSGSMGWALTQVKRDASSFIASLPEDSYVSVAVFSGHGQARLIGRTTSCTQAGKDNLARLIEKIDTLSTTVFSEGLHVVENAAHNLSNKSYRRRVILFTDGCPVPEKWSYSEEERRSRALATILGDCGSTISAIGYGNYYNSQFLSGLVEVNGASGVSRHIQDIASFAAVIADIRSNEEAASDVSINLKAAGAGMVIRTTPQVTKLSNNGTIKLRSLLDGKVTLFMSLPANASELVLEGTVAGKSFSQKIQGKRLSLESLGEAALAFAAIAFENSDRQRAADLLNQAGRPAMAARVASAFTVQEQFVIGDDLRRILLASAGIQQRYTNKSYIGKGQAACVVNLLRMLVEENCTIFIPNDPNHQYEKTTVTVVEEAWRPDPKAKMEVFELIGNQERYNFSVKALIHGQEKVAGVWKNATRNRTYVIIKDGNLHQSMLEAYLTEKAFLAARDWGVIPESSSFSEKKLYALDLSSLPMIVASWANPRQLGLADLMAEELLLMAQYKGLNARVKELRIATGTKASYPSTMKLDGNLDFYSAPCYKYELKGLKVIEFNYSNITDLAQALEERGKVDKRKRNVRFIIRLICFAMDSVGNKLFDAVRSKPVPRSNNKVEQLVSVASIAGRSDLSTCGLRRITWTEKIPVTADAVPDLIEDALDLAAAAV